MLDNETNPYNSTRKSPARSGPALSTNRLDEMARSSMRTDIHLKALSENDEEQLRKRIGELLSEPKYTKMAEQAEL